MSGKASAVCTSSPAGGSTEGHFNAVAYQNGRYGYTVTVVDPTWSWRCTGHIETGSAWVSD